MGEPWEITFHSSEKAKPLQSCRSMPVSNFFPGSVVFLGYSTWHFLALLRSNVFVVAVGCIFGVFAGFFLDGGFGKWDPAALPKQCFPRSAKEVFRGDLNGFMRPAQMPKGGWEAFSKSCNAPLSVDGLPVVSSPAVVSCSLKQKCGRNHKKSTVL